MYKIGMFMEDDSASAYYRSILPQFHCRNRLETESVFLSLVQGTPDPTCDHDALIFHRGCPAAWLPMIADLKGQGRRLVWDLDDSLFDIPEHNPAYKHFPPMRHPELRYCLRLADHVTVTTEALRRRIIEVGAVGHAAREELAAKTVVLPNLIDLDDWGKFPAPVHTPGTPFRFLWAGSSTHQRDLAILAGPIERICQRYGGDVHFVFINQMPIGLERLGPESITHMVGSPNMYYPNMISLLGCHAALAPLEDTAFTRCKSAIKWFEMTAAHMTFIASNVGPYPEVITDCVNGWLIDRGPRETEEWEYAIAQFLYGTTAHIAMNSAKVLHKAAVESIAIGHAWQSAAARAPWVRFFRMLAGLPAGDSAAALPETVESLL